MRGVTRNSILQTSTNFFVYNQNECNPPDQWSTQAILGFTLSDPFLLTVGKPPCLVILCPKSPRRDKVCPLYRVRNWGCTNIFQTPQKLYRHVKNAYSTSPFKNEEIWTASSFTIAHTKEWMMLLFGKTISLQTIQSKCYNIKKWEVLHRT